MSGISGIEYYQSGNSNSSFLVGADIKSIILIWLIYFFPCVRNMKI